jgi:hypothetical protein
MQKVLEDSFTKIFKHFSSNALQSLPVTVLGIEFWMRLNKTSRKLDERDVLEIVKSQNEKHSREINIFSYVDSCTENGITEKNVVFCINQSYRFTSNISFPRQNK